jgi:hypothetical protein
MWATYFNEDMMMLTTKLNAIAPSPPLEENLACDSDIMHFSIRMV